VNCQRCGKPFPAGSRRDRVCCSNNCSARASDHRRKNGVPLPPRWQHPALTSDILLLRATAERARQLGEANGWSRSTIRCAMDGLTVPLEGRPEGRRVTLSEIRSRAPRHASVPRVAEVLAGLGLLEDDTVPAVRSLFRFARKHGLIFANPAQRLKAAVPEPSLLPMTANEIRAVEQAITHPG
jgi:hypothetical protein